jgi:hypothetical protein
MANVEVKGLKELNENLIVFCKETIANLGLAITNTSLAIQNEAKDNHPYQDRTGHLTQSIQAQITEIKEDMIIGAVDVGMDYGVYLEEPDELPYHRFDGAYRFLLPALESKLEFFKNECRDAMRASKWVK